MENLMQIAAGTFTKNQPGAVTVPFPRPFTELPVVVLTPNYALNSITNVDCITNVTLDSFQVISPNYNPAYVINWIAVTPGAFSL
ncbi:MAG TPA: hypothetical protein VLQ45_16900 [Thermoanaerobaculia bacterium]|nr:hypothetical protein [Thermoanaerobaculia bacterium]